MMNIQYRKLLPQEATAYREIRLESLQYAPDGFGASYEEESLHKKLRFEMFIEQDLPGKSMIGAFAEGLLIGICGFIREEQLRSNHRGIIIQMYVKPEYQNQQIGYNLLKATVAAAFEIPQVEMLTLGVVADNIAANRIYEKFGFEEYGFLKNYYKSGDRYIDHRFMVLHRPTDI